MRKNFGQDESELIGDIYEAVINPISWQRVLDRVRYIADADRSNLTFFDQLNRKRNNTILSGDYPPEAVRKYLDIYIDDDVKMVRAAHKGLGEGEFFFPSKSQHRYDIADGIVGQDYKKFFREEDLKDGPVFGTALFKGTFSLGMMGVSRHKGRPPFDPEILKFWNRIGTHLRRAIYIHHQLVSSRDEHFKLREALEKTAAGIALIDNQGRVIFANSEAGRICQEHPALEIGPGGYLRATEISENKRLSCLIKGVIDSFESNTPLEGISSLPVRHTSAFHPIKVTAIALSTTNEYQLISRGVVCAVFLNDPLRKWHVSNSYMQHAYELTLSECDVASSLLNGLRTNEIAHLRGTTEETVRWQIKSILQKTQTKSQANLIKLLINLNCDFAQPIE